MSWLRIRTVIRRHWIVLWRSPHRWFEIAVWPAVDVVLWGSLGAFVARQDDASRAGAPYLLAGLMLFWVFTQVQFALASGVMEETWTRNLLNVLTTPVREVEYLTGLALFGLGKLILCLGTLSVIAAISFGFDLGQIGWTVLPVAAVLALTGWAIALIVIGLVLRFGQSAEILMWGINYVVMALSGVFFPVDALPAVLRPIAHAIPSTYGFSALRTVLDGDPVPWGDLGVGFALALVWLAASLAFAVRLLVVFRRRGFVTRYS